MAMHAWALCLKRKPPYSAEMRDSHLHLKGQGIETAKLALASCSRVGQEVLGTTVATLAKLSPQSLSCA